MSKIEVDIEASSIQFITQQGTLEIPSVKGIANADVDSVVGAMMWDLNTHILYLSNGYQWIPISDGSGTTGMTGPTGSSFTGATGASITGATGGILNDIWRYFADPSTAHDTVQLNPAASGYNTTSDLVYPNIGTEFAQGSTRIFFDFTTRSFRAGSTTGTQWNLANRGVNSVAFNMNNIASGPFSGIIGGYSNTASGEASSILGSTDSSVYGDFSALVAGNNNSVTGTYSSILSGTNNSILSNFSTIVSGDTNIINYPIADSATTHNFIGAGNNNTIYSAANNSGIVSGVTNRINAPPGFSSDQSFIGAGTSGTVEATNSAIVAGSRNYITGDSVNACICAGQENRITPINAFVGTGRLNRLIFDGNYSGIVAGQNNYIDNIMSFVGAGESGLCSGERSGIVSGLSNYIGTGAARSFIGGGESGSVTGTYGGIVAGVYNNVYGLASVIGAGQSNILRSEYAGILTGFFNSIGATCAEAFIGGGQSGSIALGVGAGIVSGIQNSSSGTGTFIGAGHGNTASGVWSTVVSGLKNRTGGLQTTIVSGQNNIATGLNCIIGAGMSNNNSGTASFIGAGYSGIASGEASFVGGGTGNVASGRYSTVVGGAQNTANSISSFAGGNRANTNSNDNTWVWSDSAGLSATAASPDSVWWGCGSRGSAGVTPCYTVWSDATRGVGVQLTTGSNTWSSTSDRNMKTNIIELDYNTVLNKLDNLPIYQYKFKSCPNNNITYMGPVSQEWHEQFQSDKNNLMIDAIDMDGVSLASIKGLYNKVKIQADEINELKNTIKNLDDKYSSEIQQLKETIMIMLK